MIYFIVELYKLVSGTLKHELQAAVSVLCWYFFNLKGITIAKRENIFSFLIAKMYEINFYLQLLARVSSTKREEFI